jgi:hypothetical protein
VYHVQLRKSMHTACAFNLSDAELRAIVEPWALEQWIELGERKWNPNEARLTVLEGPQLAVESLAMGRGWSNAEREAEDVTARVLAQARASRASSASAASAPAAVPADRSGASGPAPLEAELRDLLGDDPATLLSAWRLTAGRRPELSPSESLALAERTLSSLDGDPR